MENTIKNITPFIKPKYITKALLVLFWVVFLTVFIIGLINCGKIILMDNPDIDFFSFSYQTAFQTVKKGQVYVQGLGVAAPISFLFLYLLRPLVLVPGSIMAGLSGVLFGPLFGAFLTMLGENISANLAFYIARYFGAGKGIMDKHHLTKKLDKRLESDGLYYVLLLRFLWLPFDLVNYVCGFSKVKWRSYAIGTFFGIIPGMLTFLFLGDTLSGDNNSFWIGIGFLIFTTAIGFIMHHTKKGKIVDI